MHQSISISNLMKSIFNSSSISNFTVNHPTTLDEQAFGRIKANKAREQGNGIKRSLKSESKEQSQNYNY